MKRIYSAESLVQVVHVQNLLLAEGIAAELRNSRLLGAIGEIPFLETWPQLWVEDYVEARALGILARELSAPEPTDPEWTCKSCGETVGPQFAACWNCNAEAP